MSKQFIGHLTAASAAVAGTLGVAGASAAPISFALTFEPTGTTVQGSGTGSFTIDDSVLAPNIGVMDIAAVSAFSANFVDVPGLGALAFDLADLASINLKTDSSAAMTSLSFATNTSATDPYMTFGIFSTNNIFDPTVSIDTQVASYNTRFTQVDGPVAVDEPNALALLAAGAAGIPLIRRRRRARAKAA